MASCCGGSSTGIMSSLASINRSNLFTSPSLYTTATPASISCCQRTLAQRTALMQDSLLNMPVAQGCTCEAIASRQVNQQFISTMRGFFGV